MPGRYAATSRRVEVDDRGHPRIAAAPADLTEQPADATGPGLADADPARRDSGPEAVGSRGDQHPVHGPPGDAVVLADHAHRPVRRAHRGADRAAQPGGEPRTRWQLRAGPGKQTPCNANNNVVRSDTVRGSHRLTA